MSNRDVAMWILVFTAVTLTLVVGTLFVAANTIAMQECKALGFEWGTQVWTPEPHVECEYRLRVPLREVLPPIEQGDADNEQRDSSYIHNNLEV